MRNKKFKTCFFVAPIGKENDDIRRWSDEILTHIIYPAIKPLGYQKPERADHISSPGLITTQIIKRLVDSDLVVADLTNHNPNVFYELAIRHVVQKPVVHLIQEGQEIPFDLKNVRTIFVSTDIAKSKVVIKNLREQIKAAEKEPIDYTPVENFTKLRNLLTDGKRIQSGKVISENEQLFDLFSEFNSALRGLEVQIADLDTIINDIKGDVKTIRHSTLPSPFTERRLAKLDTIKYKMQQKDYKSH